MFRNNCGRRSGLRASAAVLAVVVPAVCWAILGSADAAQAMSGGVAAYPTEAPWVATLAMSGDGPLLQRAGCGGVLIAADRVLTAGHCVDRADPSRTEVHVNARILSADPGQVRAIRGISTLPGYEILPSPADPDNPDRSSARNDLAVILLDRPVTGIPAPPIARHRPVPGTALAVFAHGSTGLAGVDQYRNDVLHRGDLTVLDDNACAIGTPAVVDRASVLCAQDLAGSGVTGCYGDSGSPAVTVAAHQVALVGLFSFGGETAGKSCGEPAAEYLTDVTAFRSWGFRHDLVLQPYPANRPTISGHPASGSTLTCQAPTWNPHRGAQPAAIAYQWATIHRYGWTVLPVLIEGAVGPAWTVTPAMAGKEIGCLVTATNAGGTSEVMSEPMTVRSTD